MFDEMFLDTIDGAQYVMSVERYNMLLVWHGCSSIVSLYSNGRTSYIWNLETGTSYPTLDQVKQSMLDHLAMMDKEYAH